MVTGYDILKKITTRNIIAIGIIGTFLWAVQYGLRHITEVSNAIESSSALAILLGAFVSQIPVVTYFFFRKAQDKESTP